MTKNRLFLIVLAVAVTLYACNKNESFNPQGGELPTHYITLLDSGFTPSVATEANGSSFTFINSTHGSHTLMSDDTFTFKSATLLPDSFFYFHPDTISPTLQPIYIPYHCIEHPSARGVIILNP